MQSEFATKLKSALALPAPQTRADPAIVPATKAPFPGNFKGTIQEAFTRYCAEYAGRDFEDPRGVCVTLLEENFPKLVKLRFQPDGGKPSQRARAKAVLKSLREGNFDESRHFSEQLPRLRTLFWIEDVICRPHGIHPNCAAKVEGEEVYFKSFDRSGSDTKLIFTAIGYGGQRIVITSFLDRAENLHKYCDSPALWPKSKGHQ
jgi:hypothetical protein